MEFLMTYGWAILVVLAAIGALAYFGVLSPDRFLPSKCVAQPPFACTEYKVTSTGVTLVLQNNAGVDMDEVNVTFTCGDAAGTVTDDGGLLANGGTRTYAVAGSAACTPASAGSRFKGNFSVSYRQTGATQPHVTTGSIQARSE